MRRIAVARATREARHDAEIAARFHIAERGGKIFLLCYGTAVAVMGETSSASQICKSIDTARAAAMLYDGADIVKPQKADDHERTK